MVVEAYRVPTYFISYLINGDFSGLDNQDIEVIDKFTDKIRNKAKELNAHSTFTCSNIIEFGYNDVTSLACNNCVVTVCYTKNKE